MLFCKLNQNLFEMVLNALLIAMMMAIIAAPSLAITDHIVGNESGWKLNVNYTAWAQGRDFYVGDRLTFKYMEGSHNVFRLGVADDFQQCVAPKSANALVSGNDVITLATPGKKWYICGVSNHCAKGMKLGITVISSSDLAPTPAPMPGFPNPNSRGVSVATGFVSFAWVLAILCVYQMIIA